MTLKTFKKFVKKIMKITAKFIIKHKLSRTQTHHLTVKNLRNLMLACLPKIKHKIQHQLNINIVYMFIVYT